MTHQIRTPIGGVVGMIDLLNKTDLSSQQQQYLQALSQSSNALQEIIEDIVDFSRIERGNISFNKQSFEPRTLINGLVHSLAPLAHERNLELNCFIDENFPYHVYNDAQRLRQLLSNLIRHAIENCANNGVYIQARSGDISPDGHIRISISIGFTQPLDAKRLYATELPASDDALALRVGSQLTRLMGGSFDIHYSVNSKPEFALHFNWKLDELKSRKTPEHFEHRRVLIFEPDDTHREILENYCNQLGIETYQTDGKDNLIAHILWSQKKNKLFDAIILCENLKQNNTSDLIKRIRYEASCQAPILYATYIQSIGLPESSTMHDVQKSITKPISLEILARELKKLFDGDIGQSATDTIGVQQKNILLAEDSEINASIIYSHLTDMGHNVDVATDGTTALYAMHKHHYDIVFMDLQMPNTDGIEATLQWRKLEPKQTHLPIIALTAKATSDDRKKCMAAGMDGFLSKPVSPDQLAETLESFC
ncbi:MAG: response regulator, partial [Gammaproteobacteria bacterium]|nr:response regulator [Gammaproteobacteria bacterium]